MRNRRIHTKRDLLLAVANDDINIVLDYIARHPNAEIINTACDNHGASPLYLAAKNGHVGMVNALIAAGADVNAPCFNDMTNSVTSALYVAAEYGRADVVKSLIAHGANLETLCTRHGVTALHAAVKKNRLDVVSVLLTAGANVNAAFTIGESEYTPIKIAKEKGHSEIGYLIRKTQALKFSDSLNDDSDIPDELCDKTTHDIMRDPITVSTGITYDRESLIEMFAFQDKKYEEIGHAPDVIRCPITGEDIRREELDNNPCVFVKSRIAAFVDMKEKQKNLKKRIPLTVLFAPSASQSSPSTKTADDLFHLPAIPSFPARR